MLLESSATSVKGIFIYDQQIPYSIYTDEPTFSKMEFHVIMVKFIPDREICSLEFMLPKYETFRKWYFHKFSKEQLKFFKEKYY